MISCFNSWRKMEHLQDDDDVLRARVDNLNKVTNILRSTTYGVYLRNALVVIVSVSLLSFFLTLSTSISILHCYTYYFSTFLIPLLTQFTFERKYMFLICNGILVFLGLARKSGLHSPSHRDRAYYLREEEATDECDIQQDNNYVVEEHLILLQQPAESVKHDDPPCEVVATENNSMVGEVLKADAEEKAVIVREAEADDGGLDEEIHIEKENNNKEDDDDDDCGLMIGGEVDDEIEGGATNTEELNKKIEEFIRKMKEELKLQVQAQQQQQQPIIAA